MCQLLYASNTAHFEPLLQRRSAWMSKNILNLQLNILMEKRELIKLLFSHMTAFSCRESFCSHLTRAPNRDQKAPLCTPDSGIFQEDWLILICEVEVHPVAPGQVHTAKFLYGILLLCRRLTRSIVLMKWIKGRCGERECDDAMLSAQKPVKKHYEASCAPNC